MWCRCAMSEDRRMDLLVKIVLSKARSGYLLPLIARFEAGRSTPPEREYIVGLLEGLQDKRRAKSELRPIEQDLIRLRIEELIAGEGLQTKAAVAQVMHERGRERSFIFEAIRESKQRESKRREST